MPLWGTADDAAAKPQIGGRAYNAQKAREIFATQGGWSQVGAGRATTGKQDELLVAIRGLSTVKMGTGSAADIKANITSINWNITTFDKSDGGTLSVSANFNEAVTVTGNPTFAVAGTGSRNHSLVYNAGESTANRMTFILAIGAANAATNADDELTIVANPIALAGGGVTGADGGAALITSLIGLGTGAGTITVVA
tara:strand:+ start:195 stop:785 length:591 start_codon:yes stop_codon:yes gene_type:complete